MVNQNITGELFIKMIKNGAINLKNKHEEIDHLNVFPVPDGDTGTNMQMTMMAGVRELINTDTNSVVDISKILSRGLLMGARGNSGVILSQFFRGLSQVIQSLGKTILNVRDFISCLDGGRQMAYKAVSDPVEGTILTVIRQSADRVNQNVEKYNNIEEVMNDYLDQAKITLEQTPEMLPVLKQAGVVDSGGAGFIKVIEGMIEALNGKEIKELVSSDEHQAIGIEALGNVEITFGYCTEFIIKLFNKHEFEEEPLKNILNSMGDSLVLVNDDELVKVHVHTNEPGVVLTIAQKYGELRTCKIENMRIQHNQILGVEEKPKAKEEYAIIAVASGNGTKDIYKEFGINYIIDGGQTMNPPADDFVKAIKKVNAKHVIILPNNSNIILTATQSASLVSDCDIRVMKTKNVAEGYSALMAFDSSLTIDEIVNDMNNNIKNCTSGEVTYAIRDTKMDDIIVKKGDYIGLSKGHILTSKASKLLATKELLKHMIKEEAGIVTIFYGLDVTKKELDGIRNFLAKDYPDLEVEILEGKQDIYSFIIGIE
ncbi:MAG: DAK2 domain-containing protein [Acholeplasmatales bacterium]|jgi:DAK2 domain fusion protein YloV|nr:DAK2 domain-containing protein [Acholeplasmatales bacterium]